MTAPTTCLTGELPDLPHVSFRLIRNRSVDAEIDVPGDAVDLASASKAELSYYLFDGEEFPSLRFREISMSEDKNYSITVDIAIPEGKDEIQYLDFVAAKLEYATRDNLVSFMSVPNADSQTEVIAFPGSCASADSWVPRDMTPHGLGEDSTSLNFN